jgi:single-stranded-DNA-specific exonuclease
MIKKWILNNADEKLVNTLQSALNIHHTICNLLVQRGIQTYDLARDFFRPTKDLLHDPFLMKGMTLAVQRITNAIAKNEKILLYGDYDVDGTSALAVVFKFFNSFYSNIEYYVPHRFTEGYGLSQKGVSYCIENNIKLIITLDCGIKSSVLIQQALDHHIDTIVCDHHLPEEGNLPNALAILNPKQADCNYPYDELCGCGIGFKLIQAFATENDIEEEKVFELIDLVATAIAADIVPITGENRTLCYLGLEKVNSNPCIAMQALKQISKFEKAFTITDIVFIIAPRVNAAGRMDDARKAVELFIETDLDKAKELATLLHIDNSERVEIDKEITLEALEIAELENNKVENKSTVVYNSKWHKGVVGIVASRLIENYYKPTIVLTESNGFITGSARSIKGFNMFDGLTQCDELLENYGGHYFAAGLTMKHENLCAFKHKFNTIVSNSLTPEQFIPEIIVDAELSFTDINFSLHNILEQFAPHGPLNMKPVFITKGVKDFEMQTRVLKEKHIKFVVFQDGKIMNGIAFNMGHKFSIIQEKSSFDMIYQLEVNEWNGNKTIQLKVIDIL